MKRTSVVSCGFVALFAASGARGQDITSKADPTKPADFDITHAAATTDGRLTTFVMEVTGTAGKTKPAATGKVEGSKVDAYVWPTKLDPATVGFAPASGILALAITAHPDFDDTPLADENGDGNPKNDGASWHTHWVVLAEDKSCAGGLKVRDVSPEKDPLPVSAPGLPLALDSPGFRPFLEGTKVRVNVPIKGAENLAFDAVTAELQVHPEGKTPLLCVIGVRDVASGDLSLPGRVELEK
jgi:hypothetical protein